MDFKPANWERVKQLFEAALGLEPSQRSAFLIANCDETLRQQVEQLLLNYKEASSFLDVPLLDSKIAATPVGTNEKPEALTQKGLELVDVLAAAASPGAQDPMIGRQLGAYKLIRRVGLGGMAVVYLAARADDEYRKQVAIKVVQPGLDSHDLLKRFRNERQTLAELDHPNIVRLLDGCSTPDGLPFLVMDYVEGCAIDDYCDLHKLCVDERLGLFARVCEAVKYAHEKGIVHRDLKPGNILVTPDGIPKLLDFGIAKVLNSGFSSTMGSATQTRTRCMTPAYASPEQMRGKPVTTATDVYSLGVVLYELLTGHRPYKLKRHTPAEIERAICEQDPETPSTAVDRVEMETSTDGSSITKTPETVSETREGEPYKLRRRLRGDLDNIVLKALQKEPERRYSSVERLSRDIELHLLNLPVEARRGTTLYRVSKFAGRHKIEVGASLLAVFVVFAAMSSIYDPFGLRGRIFRHNSLARTASAIASRPFNPKGWLRPTEGGISLGAKPSQAGINPVVACKSIDDMKLPNTTITAAQLMTGGSFTTTGSDPILNLPPFCRIEGVIRPSVDSDIRFEIWMPNSGWNGKFRGVGNGGFGGVINVDDMAPAIRSGYAAASTDTGHRADDTDATWALRHPEKVVDAGYRAIHEMTQKSKQLMRDFYGQGPTRSFFEGCSNGGRQALMEAQRFPDDYDGILAGAAPTSTAQIVATALNDAPKDPGSYIPARKIPAITRAVLAECDALDGIKDGILSDPRQCHFDPAVLVCTAGDSDNCLTPKQVAQLEKIYRGMKSSNGDQLFPGYAPGGEEGEIGWKAWIIGSTSPQDALNYIFAMGLLRNMVFDDPNWNLRVMTPESTIRDAGKKLGPIIDAQQSDLGRFRAHGGKMILYHGWSDPETPGLIAIDYYNAVVSNMGQADADSFLRLYMVPGMQHCYGGPGPNFFGQFDLSALGGNSQHFPVATDPQHNIFSALEQWVEGGAEPGSIVATKFVNESDPTQGVAMTRPLCPYPKIAKYKGTGGINDAANFACAENNDQLRLTLTP